MLNSIWDDFLKIVQEELGTRIVETWIKSLNLYKYDSKDFKLYLSVPNSFIKSWITRNYKELFNSTFKRLLNVNYLEIIFTDKIQEKIETIIVETSENFEEKDFLEKNTNLKKKEKENTNEKKEKKSLANKKKHNLESYNLNQSYNFENFVVGENNSFAFSAANAILKDLGGKYNPILFYGKSGTGKTHLIQALGNKLLEINSDLKILYQTADRFVFEFVNSARTNSIDKFQEKYKDLNVLLIDDIQSIANKEQSQEILFNIFNYLYDKKKQIIFTSDSLPRDIFGINERLKSRLESGLITDLQVPFLETRINIIKKKAAIYNYEISEDIASYIALNIFSNIRDLESALIRVSAFSSLTDQPLTLELVKKVLGYLEKKKIDSLKLEDLSTAIEKELKISLKDLRSRIKNSELNLARQITMYLMKKHTNKSLKEICIYLNRNSHGTAFHAISKIEKELQINNLLFNKIQNIEKCLF